jgi:hypothetical protein
MSSISPLVLTVSSSQSHVKGFNLVSLITIVENIEWPINSERTRGWLPENGNAIVWGNHGEGMR